MGRVAHILGYEILACDLHEVAAGQHLEAVEDFGEKAGDGGLSGARIAEEHEVRLELDLGVGVFALLPLYLVDYRADFVLDLLKAHEGVELCEYLLLGEFLERFVGYVGFFERPVLAAAFDFVEGVGFGEPACELAVLSGLSVAEFLLEHEAELLLRPGRDGRPELVGDDGGAEPGELDIVERQQSEIEFEE